MNYIGITFNAGENQIELLIAFLDASGYEGFQQNDNGLIAYIAETKFQKEVLDRILRNTGLPEISYTVNTIKEQNWNAIWEKNFQPVQVAEFCRIRAPFHSADKKVRFDIVIEPKMSFGTGHHETTQLMIECMQKMELKNKRVLDMGCGTGILAILASLMDASEVIGVDIDERACQNSLENAHRNNVNTIRFIKGDIDQVAHLKFEVILANIKRNVLLQHIRYYFAMLKKEGYLLLSGILNTDFDAIYKEISAYGYTLIQRKEINNWLALLFRQNN
jgi:ribosomal protein L11 methyltransferase